MCQNEVKLTSEAPSEEMKYTMTFNESEMETMAWLLKSEIQVQEQLLEHNDGSLLAELKELYESFTW